MPLSKSVCRLADWHAVRRSFTDPVTKPSVASAVRSTRLDDAPGGRDGARVRNHAGFLGLSLPYNTRAGF
jgi:hypothetical protein